MKAKKKSKVLLIIFIICILIASVTFYIIFNPPGAKGEVRLNLFEQQWIQNNKNTVINVSIPNDIPLYSSEGKGLAFSFLDYFSTQTELEFNKTPYIIGEKNATDDNQFRIVKSDEKLNKNDLVFSNDNYVIISKKSTVKVAIDNINAKIGVLDTDFNIITSYLVDKKLTITKVNNITLLLNMLDDDEVSYIIVPKNRYLDLIIKNNYHIVNTLSNVSLKYVLTLSNKSGLLNDIMNKYYKEWIKTYLIDNYNSELFNLYTTIKKIDDKSKTDFKSKRYIYGYVNDLPYETNVDDTLGGLNAEFINAFTSFSGVEFNFIKYDSVAELDNAIKKDKVDVAFNYYNLNTANTKKTVDLIDSDYVILTNNQDIIIDTIKSLPNETVYTLKGTRLSNYIKLNGSFNVIEKAKLESLKGKKIVLIDYNSYIYYRNNYFKNYKIVYQSKVDDNYGYIVNKSSSNDMFYNVFNYYLSNLNHKQYENNGMNKMLSKTINLDLSLLWLYIILLPTFIIVIAAVLAKRKKIIKMRTDIKLKYIDPLTSLKNRYYLNNNISKWEGNNIYPQAMIIINVNNLKDINDAYGHECGDQLIKTAANILINNQLEKTDMIRTDGNEFAIYMVGYDEAAVTNYIRRLAKLFKDLPYEYGATIGYSMIEDDIKTIEDALNEAILDAIANRENKKNFEG